MNRADLETELARVRAENASLRYVIQRLVDAQRHLLDAQRPLLDAQAILTIPDFGGHD